VLSATGDNEQARKDATAAALTTVEEFARDVAAGRIEIPVADPPDDAAVIPDDESAAGDREEQRPAPPTPDLAVVRVDRRDPAERWFVEALLHVEDQLGERTEPMVFLVYGRGRAHPPCVGKGIRPDPLAAQVRFILGACSCTAKRENPGLDLLTRADWATVALALAQRSGPETGNEHLLGGDAFPEIFPKAMDGPTAPAADRASRGDAAVPALESESRTRAGSETDRAAAATEGGGGSLQTPPPVPETDAETDGEPTGGDRLGATLPWLGAGLALVVLGASVWYLWARGKT
jgi:hypothetical protein